MSLFPAPAKKDWRTASSIRSIINFTHWQSSPRLLFSPSFSYKGALLFSGLYFVIFLITFVWLFPSYVEMVWKLSSLTGILVVGVPLEEILFAVALGAMWGSIYEHLTWRKLVRMK
ncbi:MAG: lycopene cyclase domain-containing protein [Microgenomates group bacterium]